MNPMLDIFPPITISRDTFVLALHDTMSQIALTSEQIDALDRVGREATVVAVGDYDRVDGACCPWTLAGYESKQDRWSTFGVAFDDAVRNRVGKVEHGFRTLLIED